MPEATMVVVKEVYLKSDRSSGNMVVLKEKEDDNQHFLMFVGDSEFAAIAKEKGLVEPKRPLTHDFYMRIFENLAVEFLRIEIYDMKDNTFYATLYLEMDGKKHAIDSRPSDAIAIALRTQSPIFISEDVINKSRKIDLQETSVAAKNDKESEKWAEILEKMSPEDFGKYKM